MSDTSEAMLSLGLFGSFNGSLAVTGNLPQCTGTVFYSCVRVARANSARRPSPADHTHHDARPAARRCHDHGILQVTVTAA